MGEHGEYGEEYYDPARDGGRVVDPEYRTYITDLHFIASQPAGQRVLIRILESLGTFEPAWHPKNAQMAKAIVLKDFGHDLLDDLAVASGEAHDAIQKSIRISRRARLTNQIFSTEEETI